jgi:hypothetical protein
MAFRIRDLMISVLPSAAAAYAVGCPTCTGTTGQGGGCQGCTGTIPHAAGWGGGWGCPTCTGTTHDLPRFGCMPCTGTTHEVCTQAAALLACGACTGASPAQPEDLRIQALAQIRQQLQTLLAEIEAEEKRLEEASFPKTTEEAEALEAKLEEALAEVRSRKSGLRKG